MWDDAVHPVFRMNLPEGYLLHVLEEQFGPHSGASPLALLSVVGRNMIGRVQVAAVGAGLEEPISPLSVQYLLKGDNSDEAFSNLVRKYATSGVSGVIPKFLDAQRGPRFSHYNKATLFTRKHIVKGSSKNLPYVALNEYLAMQVASKVVSTAVTEISEDGQALVVHRFDVDENGRPSQGLEDFCALLGMRPAAKYETTWERIAEAVRDHVPGPRQREAFQQLAVTLLLTYALRNADCHSKNIALLYTSRDDVHLAPVYDMLTTCIYGDYKDSPPGISFMGKKTWHPGKNLERFITSHFGVNAKEQALMVERISYVISDTAPQVRTVMEQHPRFRDLVKNLLNAWSVGVNALQDKRVYNRPGWEPGNAFLGFSDPPKLKVSKRIAGQS